MTELNAKSETDASNTDISGANVAENCPMSGLNDAIRNLAGMAKRAWDRDHATATVGGTGNAITLTYSVGPAAYVTGEKFTFVATAANTGATTVNVSGLGAKNVFRKTGAGVAACVGGEIQNGDIVEIEYDGTQMQIVGGAASVAKQPTRTVLTSGTGATYTTPAGVTRLNLRMIGAGGGGGGSGVGAGNGGNGTASTWSGGSLSAGGGSGATANALTGVGGGVSANGDINITGNAGASAGDNSTVASGGHGGGSAFGGGGIGGPLNTNGSSGATNSGGGGGGAGSSAGQSAAGGGGGGGYCEKLITGPAATYTYTVGAVGSGGSAGTGAGGGSGGAGLIIVDEFYN